MATATWISTKDITTTLARLRIARIVDDRDEIRSTERRLNWLLDQLNREQKAATP